LAKRYIKDITCYKFFSHPKDNVTGRERSLLIKSFKTIMILSVSVDALNSS